MTLASSFTSPASAAGGGVGLSFDWYRILFEDEGFWQSLMYTVGFSVIVTLFALYLSVVLLKCILTLTIKGNGEKLLPWLKWVEFPMLMPYVASAFILGLMLRPYGVVSALGYFAGVVVEPESFPLLVNDSYGIGVILSYVWKTTPFIMVMNLPMMFKVHKTYGNQSRMLELNDGNYFWNIVLPLVRKGLVISACIVFAFVLTAVEIPMFLGVTHPKALGVLALQIFQNGEFVDRPLADAVNVIQMILVAVSMAIGMLLSGRSYDIEG